MSDGFVELIDSSNAFFRELAENNTKDWFDPRKAHYTAEIKKPAELLADLVAEDVARLTGHSHAPKVFRINRDVRFSKDKRPYNAHLHLMWGRKDAAGAPVWFFGSAPDYLIVGMGIHGLSGPGLAKFRAFIDSDGDDLAAAMAEAAEAQGTTISDWGPEPLKRVPKPYPQDYPHADLLKRKQLTLTTPLPPAWREGLIPAIRAAMQGLHPIWVQLDRVAGG